MALRPGLIPFAKSGGLYGVAELRGLQFTPATTHSSSGNVSGASRTRRRPSPRSRSGAAHAGSISVHRSGPNGKEIDGLEDLEVAFGVPAPFGSVDDLAGRFVPGDFFRREGGAQEIFRQSFPFLDIVRIDRGRATFRDKIG